MKHRFSDEQIIRLLEEAKKGTAVSVICRKNEISRATFYRWGQEYGHMQMTKIGELRKVKLENERLKRVVADLTLENQVFKEAGARKKYLRKSRLKENQ